MYGFLDGEFFGDSTSLDDTIYSPLRDKLRKQAGMPTTIQGEMNILYKQIVRYRYLQHIHYNENYEFDVYKRKMRRLKELEKGYPQYKLEYSPTNHEGFTLEMATQVFGEEWSIVRDTATFISEFRMRLGINNVNEAIKDYYDNLDI